jgi:hypothetical protein
MTTQGQVSERSAEEIRQDIAARRDSISEAVDKLGDKIQETLDWREYVSSYPMIALGAAAGLGFLVSGIFKRDPTPRERMMDAMAEMVEDFKDRAGDIAGDVVKWKVVGGKTVKAAITGVITKAAMDFAKNQVQTRLTGGRRTGTYERPQPYSRTQAIADFQPDNLDETHRPSTSNYKEGYGNQ